MAYGKSVTALIQLAMVPVLATAWGMELFGQWLLLATVPAFLAASDFGFGTAAGNRLIGEVAAQQHAAALSTFQSALLVIMACTSAFAMLALVAVFAIPDSTLSIAGAMDANTARTVAFVLIGYGLIGLQGSLFMATLRSEGAFARSTSYEATIQLAEGLGVIGVALAGLGPFHAALALLAARLGGLLGLIALARRFVPWLRLGIGAASAARARELAKPAIAAMMLPLATAGYLQGTALAVGAAAGVAAVPIYTSLRTLSRVTLQVLMALNLPILPEFTAEYSRGNLEWITRATGAIRSLNTVAGILGAAGLGLFGEWLLAQWTRGNIVAPPMMIWLTAAGMAAACLWNPLSNLLLAVNRHERFTFWYVAASFAAVGLTYFAVGHLGITGAALASLALDLFMLACVIRMSRQVFGPIPFRWPAWPGLRPSS